MIDLLSKVLPTQVKRKRLWPLAALLLALAAILILALLGLAFITSGALANGQDQVCPHGGEWSEHQDPEDFGEVNGAVEYCVKGGNVEHSDCIGYLEYGNLEYVQGVVNQEGACGLSHWSYRLGDEPTEIPDPTPTPTDEPTPTPTDDPGCEVNCEDPTPTPTDDPGCEQDCEDPTPTPTDPPPTEPPVTPELPKAGFTSQVEIMNGEPWIVMVNGETTVWAAHNQEGWPAYEWAVTLWPGREFYWEYSSSPGWYTVTDYILAQPEDVHLIYSTKPDIILITCRGYDPVTNSWAQRLVIYADLSQ